MPIDLFILKAFDPATQFEFAAVVLTIVISIVLHELAHGAMALRLGDPTPRLQNRMTPNPLVHMGPFSIMAMLLVGIAWGSMPIDPTRIKGKYGEAKVAFAGPSTNLALGLAALVALGLTLRVGLPEAGWADNLTELLWLFGAVNLWLFVFNMMPAPPLDGSHILANFWPKYANFLGDPSKQGVYLIMFFGAFAVLRVATGPIAGFSAWLVTTVQTLGV